MSRKTDNEFKSTSDVVLALPIRAIRMLTITSATLVRLVACVQDPETIRYFNSMNDALPDEVSLAFPSPQGMRPVRKSGGPSIDHGNAIAEACFGGRKRFAGTSVRTISRSIRPEKCPQNCGCACHKVSLHPIPFSFRRALKRMFPRLVDDPVLVRRCTKSKCSGFHARQTGVVVVLHAAFVSRAVILSAMSRGLRLKVHIKSYPVVSETSDIIQYAQQGNVGGMRRLFRTDRATPCDISQSDGWSVLHVRFSSCRMPT
jgi:hypothetical protein